MTTTDSSPQYEGKAVRYPLQSTEAIRLYKKNTQVNMALSKSIGR